MLVDSIQQVNTMQLEADQAVETMFTGGDVNPAEVLTAVQKADLAFRLTMQMRNKLMEVYQEIKDIQNLAGQGARSEERALDFTRSSLLAPRPSEVHGWIF